MSARQVGPEVDEANRIVWLTEGEADPKLAGLPDDLVVLICAHCEKVCIRPDRWHESLAVPMLAVGGYVCGRPYCRPCYRASGAPRDAVALPPRVRPAPPPKNECDSECDELDSLSRQEPETDDLGAE